MTGTVTVVSKGKTAENANSYIDAFPGTSVACINDSALLLRDDIIPDYCFFSDVPVSHNIFKSGRKHHRYIARGLRSFPSDLPKGFPVDDLTLIRDIGCHSENHNLGKRILDGGICWHHTTPGAIHWLAKHGKFRHIRIIGVPIKDEPHMRASGVEQAESFRKIMTDKGMVDYIRAWNDVTHRVCELVSRTYGVQFERYEDTDENSYTSQND